MSNRSADAKATDKPRESFGEIIRTVIYALLIALVFRTVLFQPFSIPSGSMKSTLLIGDYLFVSKYSYGYSRFSLPYGHLLPEGFLGDRLFGAEPKRGDVIVFKMPRDKQTDYIKRLVGLPGDTIQVRRGVLYVNGEPVGLRPTEPFEEPRALSGREARSQLCVQGSPARDICVKDRYVETLPNGVEYSILDANGGASDIDNTSEFKVLDGHFFFMGDNRDNSRDSRSAQLGQVPRENLVGRAEMVLLSSEGAFWEVWKWRSDRFFTWID